MSLTDFDYELLSAYIDDALAQDERASLEARLAAEPELRSELRAMRQVVALVNNLPALKAPRNFTLTADMLQTPSQQRDETARPKIVEFSSTTQQARRKQTNTRLWWIGAAASFAILFVFVAAVLAPYLQNGPTGETGSSVAIMSTATPAALRTQSLNSELTAVAKASPAAANAVEEDVATDDVATDDIVEEEAAAESQAAAPPTVDTLTMEEAGDEALENSTMMFGTAVDSTASEAGTTFDFEGEAPPEIMYQLELPNDATAADMAEAAPEDADLPEPFSAAPATDMFDDSTGSGIGGGVGDGDTGGADGSALRVMPPASDGNTVFIAPVAFLVNLFIVLLIALLFL